MSKEVSKALKQLCMGRLKSKNYFPSAASVRRLHLSRINPVLALAIEEHQDQNQSHTCVEPLSKLKPTIIKELEINTVTTGKYIILRNLEECVFRVGWHTVVEDTNGGVCFLSVYNYPILEVPCVGDVLIVKEPLFLNTKRKVFCIKIDSPTDITIVNPSHRLHLFCKKHKWQHPLQLNHERSLLAGPVPQTNIEWFNRGNLFFKSRLYRQARDAYTISLEYQTIPDMKYWKNVNMALCKTLFILGYYELAMVIIRKVLYQFPRDKEALPELVKLTLMYKLRTFVETDLHVVIDKTIKNTPEYLNLKQFQAMLETTESYTHEVVVQYITKNFTTPDITYYLGPIKCIEGCRNGKSYAVTKSIPANTLLMAGKALASKFSKVEDGFDYLEDSLRLVPEVAKLIMQNPVTFGKVIYDLPKTKNEEVVGFIDSDKKRVESICHMNVIRDICNLL